MALARRKPLHDEISRGEIYATIYGTGVLPVPDWVRIFARKGPGKAQKGPEKPGKARKGRTGGAS